MTRDFTAIFEEVPEGGYIAYVEELPGANTQGETLDEARQNLKDAIAMLLQTRRDILGEKYLEHKIIRERISVPLPG